MIRALSHKKYQQKAEKAQILAEICPKLKTYLSNKISVLVVVILPQIVNYIQVRETLKHLFKHHHTMKKTAQLNSLLK